ncbi:MAG TPA: tetratricopeptide repeat protein [Pyrinomonadaceae bacterium]|nr:tetratricopeptide repeat protein [Pyrinomonadaceae bacterium]
MNTRSLWSRFIFLAALALVGYSASHTFVSQAENAAAQNEQATVLETGKPVTRSIGGGQAHSYKILATAGDYLKLAVNQRAVDVVVSLYAPNGKKLLQVDNPNGAFGPEPLITIVDATGTYLLEVKTFQGNVIAGSYEIQFQELRPANEQEKSQVPLFLSAQQTLDRAVQIANQGPASARSAIATYEEALALYRQLKEPYWQALTLSQLAQIYSFLGDQQKSIDYHIEALAFQKALNDARSEAVTLDALGEIYFQRGEKQKALELLNLALPLRKKANDASGEASTRLSLGRVHSSLGETKKAFDFFTQALELYRAAGDPNGQATSQANIAKIYVQVGDLKKALELYNQALTTFAALGNQSAEAKTQIDLGGVYNSFGEKQKALNLFTRALSFFRKASDRRSEGITLNNIAFVYESLGEHQRALELYNQALAVQRSLNHQSGVATTLNNIGALYYSISEQQKALEFYGQALALHQAIVDPDGEAAALNNIGTIYRALGEIDKALEFFNRALTIRRSISDKKGEANTLNSLGTVYELTDRKKALELINKSLSLYREVGDRSGEATALGNLGTIYKAIGDTQKALEFYNQGLTLQKAIGNRGGEANLLSNIGTLYADTGEHRKALESYGTALTIRSAIADRSGEAITLINMMLLASDYNRSLAIFFGKRAVNLLQQLRASVSGLDKEQQKTFLRNNERTYRILAYMLIGSGRLPEAHQVLNLFKDQQFFDFNRSNEQSVSSLTLTPRESVVNQIFERTNQRIAIVGEQIVHASQRVDPNATGPDRQQLEAQLKTASDDFLASVKQADTDFSRAGVEGNKLSDIADTLELQKTLKDLAQQTGQKAVAVYTLLDKELEGAGDGSFSALVVTPDAITFTTQPVKGDALNKKALQLWGLLQSDQYDPRPLAEELYAVVFKPIESRLPKDTTTILWSLDGNLRYLPMGALYDGKQYLVERYNHAVFTRADGERLTRAVSPRWTGLGLGSSEAHTVEVLGDKISFDALPGVTEELRQLFRQSNSPGGVIDGEVLPDAKFTRAAMLAALKQKRPLVHISSHFSFRPGDEARSFLLLGDGTAMTLEEMKQHVGLFSGVELLTLSACNTAAQQEGNGREIDGFAELAQRLGAASVMATLWPVADNSTPWLMREFYQTRQSGQGLSKAEAFGRAQLALLNGTAQTQPLPAGEKGSAPPITIVIGEKGGSRAGAGTRADVVYVDAADAPPFKRDDKKPFAHPYYWAPFILIGNWK